MSAQICSLSANAAALIDAGITTGRIQVFLSLAAAAKTWSVRDTAMPSTPLNPCSEGFEETFDVRLA